jgi:hypothetical protein
MSGTKRTRIDRQQRAGLITPQTISLYRRALKLHKRAHLSDADQRAAYDAENDVDRALGIKLWQISVFLDEYFVRDTPPDNIVRRGRTDDWYHTRELRRQLAEADRELRRQERAARRVKAAPPSPPAPAV